MHDAVAAGTAALDAEHITKIGVIVIVVLIVGGIVLSLLVTKLVGKIIIFAVVVAVAIIVWQQRSTIENNIDSHKCDLTFFGVHVNPPYNSQKHCK